MVGAPGTPFLSAGVERRFPVSGRTAGRRAPGLYSSRFAKPGEIDRAGFSPLFSAYTLIVGSPYGKVKRPREIFLILFSPPNRRKGKRPSPLPSCTSLIRSVRFQMLPAYDQSKFHNLWWDRSAKHGSPRPRAFHFAGSGCRSSPAQCLRWSPAAPGP